MTAARTLFLLIATGLAALALVGCGGGSSEGDGGTTSTTGTETQTGTEDTTSAAYQGGYEICKGETVEELAAQNGIEPSEEAVADTVAELVSGGSEEQQADGRAGCLAAFAEKEAP